jgi:hypothetical protein
MVPEHFVWHVLSQLTEALIALQEGVCDQSRDEPAVRPKRGASTRSQFWTPQIHSDIKLLNIFCAKDNVAYPSYPKVLLADFDTVQDEHDLQWSRCGTRGWQPPVSGYL